MTDATATSASGTSDGHGRVPLEDFVAGRLTLVMLHNQLETQIETLRSQMAIAGAQLEQTEDLLRRADEKMAAEHPAAFAQVTGQPAPASKRRS
jgi:hypothetical protein